MEFALIIYLIDVVCGGFFGLGYILFLVLLISCMAYFVKGVDKNAEPFLKTLPLKTMIIVPATLLTLSNFIPTKETAYKMLAAYGAQSVVENPEVKEVFGEGMDVLKLSLLKYKKDLEKEIESE